MRSSCAAQVSNSRRLLLLQHPISLVPNTPFHNVFFCTYPCIAPRMVRLSALGTAAIVDIIRVCYDWGIGDDKCWMLLSQEWQSNYHQAVIDTLGRAIQLVHLVGSDNKPLLSKSIHTPCVLSRRTCSLHLLLKVDFPQPASSQCCYLSFVSSLLSGNQSSPPFRSMSPIIIHECYGEWCYPLVCYWFYYHWHWDTYQPQTLITKFNKKKTTLLQAQIWKIEGTSAETTQNK